MLINLNIGNRYRFDDTKCDLLQKIDMVVVAVVTTVSDIVTDTVVVTVDDVVFVFC